ncbi:MAG TPA: DegT/DnrJ/EryC1/StrS family aminotransferase [Herpetosiphonaceae bacterium]
MGSKLAMFGGPQAVPREQRQVQWPIVTDADKEAVLRVLDSGKFTPTSEGEQEARALEQEWAQLAGTRYAAGVSNGTAAIALALAALGIQPGDEVLVPALSFIASAMAPVYQLAIPVFVDIDPRTFNIDPTQIEARITPRTRAIIPVHFHGLPADMDSILTIARKHDLVVVEDVAQAPGATYKGRPVGSLGDMGAFSLNVQKNIPTCGEGGLVTTDDPILHEKVVMLRQFGEVIKEREDRSYLSHMLSWNYKLNSVQAAFTRSQLQRYPDYQERRDRNISAFLKRLAELPGLIVPYVPSDCTHVYHIMRLRFDPAAAGLDGIKPGPFRQAVRRAMRAEGVPISQYQMTPLPGQHPFQTQQGYGHGYPWTLPGLPPQRYAIEDYPTTLAVINDSLTLQRRHLNPDSGPLLQFYADAFEKVWENLDRIGRMAESLPYEAPWEAIAREGPYIPGAASTSSATVLHE